MHIYYYDEKFKYQGEDVISDYDEMPKKATDVRPKRIYMFLNMMRKRENGLNQHPKSISIA